MTSSVEQLTSTLTDQHHQIKTLMETVLTQEGAGRQTAFAELCGFLAAHEAAEEECLHAPAKEKLDGDTTVVDRRIEEEDEAGRAIAELKRLGTSSPEFRDKFEKFRLAVIAHAEAEEDQELPQLSGTLDGLEVKRMQGALARVPYLVSRNGNGAASFKEQLQSARAEVRSGSPTARRTLAGQVPLDGATQRHPNKTTQHQEGSTTMGWQDKLDNAKDEAVGRAKEHIGRATDDDEMEREGRTERAKSNLKQAGEKVKDAVRDN